MKELALLRFIVNFSNGRQMAFLKDSGVRGWPSTMKWKELPGCGNRRMVRISKLLLAENLLDPTQRIVEKKGSKRSILVDENGVPLSLVVTGANRHDSVVLDSLLKARLLDPPVEKKQTQNLCLDAAYVGKEKTVEDNGFVPHIRPRGEEKKLIEKDPDFKACRWVVELAHSWFNRFRKLVPRYEKTDLSYNALNALAAAMIVLNKVMVIYR